MLDKKSMLEIITENIVETLPQYLPRGFEKFTYHVLYKQLEDAVIDILSNENLDMKMGKLSHAKEIFYHFCENNLEYIKFKEQDQIKESNLLKENNLRQLYLNQFN